MNLTVEHLEALIGEAETEARKAEEALAERKAVLSFLRRVLESAEVNGGVLPGVSVTPKASSPPEMSEMTLPEALQTVLRSAGHPLHVRDIRHRLIESGYRDRKNLEITITSAARRRTDLFVRVRKATYGLRNGVT